MKNFILTDETLLINNSGTTLHRIQATIDFGSIKSGDTGGWIEHDNNIDENGWVYDEAKVYGNGLVGGNGKIFDNVEVFEMGKVGGTAEIYDDVKIHGKAKVGGTAKLHSDIVINNEIIMSKDSWSGVTVINGSKHDIWQPTKKAIAVGCTVRPINFWIDNFANVGAKMGYTQEEIDEYGIYIQQIADLYN